MRQRLYFHISTSSILSFGAWTAKRPQTYFLRAILDNVRRHWRVCLHELNNEGHDFRRAKASRPRRNSTNPGASTNDPQRWFQISRAWRRRAVIHFHEPALLLPLLGSAADPSLLPLGLHRLRLPTYLRLPAMFGHNLMPLSEGCCPAPTTFVTAAASRGRAHRLQAPLPRPLSKRRT